MKSLEQIRADERALCRHTNQAQHNDTLITDGEVKVVVSLQCVSCWATLSLGPAADDSEQVRVEIRATEIADGDSDSDSNMLEWAGGRCYAEGHEMPRGGSALAGYLAAAMLDEVG